jgi:hypothetical protein
MRYGEVVQRSLSVFLRFRYIWLLGALGGGETVGGGFGNFGAAGQGPGSDTGTGSVPNQFANELGQWVSVDLGLLAVLLALLLLFFLVYFVLSCATVGGAIRAAAEHDAEQAFGLGPAWRAGWQSFLPILGLRLLGLLLVLPALLLIAGMAALAALSAARGSADGIVTAVLAAIVAVPVLVVAAVVLGVVWTLATRAIVLERHGVIAALERGFRQVWNRLGRVTVVWLIALGIGILTGIGAGVLSGLLLLPFLIVLSATYAAAGVDAALTAGAVLLLLYIVGVVLLNGAVGSFLTTYWTIAYRRLELEPATVQTVPGPAA